MIEFLIQHVKYEIWYRLFLQSRLSSQVEMAFQSNMCEASLLGLMVLSFDLVHGNAKAGMST